MDPSSKMVMGSGDKYLQLCWLLVFGALLFASCVVHNLFQPPATQTKNKIVGANVLVNRSLDFVDYDLQAPVLSALQEKDQLKLQGLTLDMQQKTAECRSGRGAGG